MNNNVVYRAAKALVAVASRRSVSISAASARRRAAHAEGVGEEDDVRAAVDFLREQAPGKEIWIAGFSFGARVGLRVGARSDDVAKLFGHRAGARHVRLRVPDRLPQTEGDRAGSAG
jgi:alpha/beta superfamily hydrolase